MSSLTVKQLISQLLECPMDAKVIATKQNEEDATYSYYKPKFVINYEDGYIGIMLKSEEFKDE